MSLTAELAHPAPSPVLYLNSPLWAMEQKLDGHRVMIQVVQGKAQALNRYADRRDMPGHLQRAFTSRFKGEWLFDGELVGDLYYVFDVLVVHGNDVSKSSWADRNALLQREVQNMAGVEVVKSWTDSSEKHRMFKLCSETQVEGVIFKRVDARHRNGRSKNWMKWKFVVDVDCVIMDSNIGGRDNFLIGLYKEGKLTEVGKVSSLTGDGPDCVIGDVVTITALNVSPDGRLIQPVLPRLRTDKPAQECTWDQLDTIMKTHTLISGDDQ